MKKRFLFTALLAAFFANILSAQLVFTVQATADRTEYNYTIGNTYTFVFQTGSSYPEGSLPSSNFYTNQNDWREEDTTDNQLFLSVTGDGLQGSFTRPISASDAPYSSINYYNDGTDEVLALHAGTDDSTQFGLSTLDNQDLLGVQLILRQLNFSSPTFTEIYTDPVSYLTAHVGSYSPGVGPAGSSLVRLNILGGAEGSEMIFTPTSLTITAVPEPATVTLGLGLAALGVVLIRRRRA